MGRGRGAHRRRTAVLVAVVVLLAAPGATGCGDAESPAATGTTTATTPDATPDATPHATGRAADHEPATPVTTAGEDADADTTAGLGQLPPGEHIGRLTGLSDGEVNGSPVAVIGFDKVDFLTGDAAVAAAREDGYIGPDDTGVPNDYYVRNVNPLVRLLPVAPGSPVLVLDGGSPRLVPADLEEAMTRGSLFRIQVDTTGATSTVTAVEAVYVP